MFKWMLIFSVSFVIFSCVDNDLPEVEVERDPHGSSETKVDPILKEVNKLSEGSSAHTCVVFSNNRLRCWGNNSSGQLGLGHTSTIGDDEFATENVDLGGKSVSKVSTGWAHTCVLFTDGKVRCWGASGSGRLGLGALNNIGDDEKPTEDISLGTTVTDISAGYAHTCAVLTSGDVRCWGQGTNGRLGIGTTDNIGDDESPSQNVNLGGATVTQVAAGGSFSCALLSTGDVRCWGNNSVGMLGLGNTDTIGDDESPTTNIDFSGATVTQISVADSHACALLSTGAIRCWGANTSGQLGLGNTERIGDNESPTANVNLGGATATQVSVGSELSCALLSSGDVRCWGNANNGKLGLGSTERIGDDEDPTVNVDLGGENVTAIHAASSHVCALLSSKMVRCWGWGQLGRNGLGNTENIGDDENPTLNVGESN